MIENIRKYSGLMIVVFVILFISFFFMDSSALQSVGGGGAVIKIDGRTYSDKEYVRLGNSAFKLTSSLAQSGDMTLYQFIMSLTGGATSQEEAAEKFFIGRTLLRNAREQFGIHPGDEEISSHIRTMRAFAGPDGNFSEESYRRSLEGGLGRLGLTEADLRELVADVLVSQKISAIVGAGLGADREAVAKNLALENQQISVELARLDLAPFQEKFEPAEEEIKNYWETLQDAFVTEPRRKFTYIVAKPDLPEEPAEPDPEPNPEELPEDATDEEKEAARTAAETARNERTAKLADDRRAKQREHDLKVDDFLSQLEQQSGAGFEELASDNGWEIKTTPLVSRSEAPADLDVDLRASSSARKAADVLFQIPVTSDPTSRISDAMAVGENEWIVARVDEVEPSRPKTYEEARDEARAQYIAEHATDALKAAAEEAAEKIRESMAAGKSFTEAAKEAGLDEIKSVPAVTRHYRPDGESEPPNLFDATRTIDPGSLADVIVETERAFIVYVEKREVVKEENAAARLESEVASRSNENQTIAFLSWLKSKTEAANVERLNRR